MNLDSLLITLGKDAAALYKEDVAIESAKNIPEPAEIPLQGNTWIRLEDVTCVYADMMRSTQLSVRREPQTVAKLYQLFTGNAVRILNEFDAEYIDVRGDGAFGLFSGRKGFYKALAAAVTVKTFTARHGARIVKESGLAFPLTCHLGIQSGRLLVKKLGLRGDMQNEVWAGRPVNVAAKLASRGGAGQLVVSKNVYDRFESDLIYLSCGCGKSADGRRITGKKSPLWKEVEVDPSVFGSGTAHVLDSDWCVIHGEETCNGILAL